LCASLLRFPRRFTHLLVSFNIRVCYFSSLLFFFSTIPPPPRSTLFPYTTLFRSFAALWLAAVVRPRLRSQGSIVKPVRSTAAVRSEEHTSELQSPDHLVCRLLLEKKKKKKKNI